MYPNGEQRQQQQQFSANKSSTSHSTNSRKSFASNSRDSCAGADGVEDPDDYQTSDTIVKRCTPVLFSTNRGLHLRVAKSSRIYEAASATSVAAGCSKRLLTSSAYDIRFCDLERWSTNRANTVSLEDTFTISQPSHSLASQHSRQSAEGTNHNCSFIPQIKRTSVVRFNNNSFSRFEMPRE